MEECGRVLRRTPPKIPKGPQLPVLRSSLRRRMDKAVGLHSSVEKKKEPIVASAARGLNQY